MKRLVLVISTLVILVVGALLFSWTRFTSFLESPALPGAQEKVVVVPKDATPASIAVLFEKEGLIERVDWLAVYFDHFARDVQIKPGEYALSASMAPMELLRRIGSGKVVTYTVTIPPGARAKEIVGMLASKGLGEEAELSRLVFDKKLANELGLASDSLEGYLFPDLYELPRGLAPSALLGQLVGRYRKVVTESVLNPARARGLTEHELVTLASLVEKADILPNERRVYSAMLHNRLEAGEPLESEASAEYGIERLGLAAEQERAADHPWNTMLHEGLPPTPIASPGIAAIVAAAEPATSGAMFMVKRADGTHVFCSDLECYKTELERWHPGSRPHSGKRHEKRRR